MLDEAGTESFELASDGRHETVGKVTHGVVAVSVHTHVEWQLHRNLVKSA